MSSGVKVFLIFFGLFIITAGSLTYITYKPPESAPYLQRPQVDGIETSQDSKVSIFSRFLNTITQRQKTTAFENLISEINNNSDSYSVYIKEKNTNYEYIYNSDREYYGASLFKIIIAQAVFTKVRVGSLRLDDKITFRAEDYTSGTGTLQSFPAGAEFTVDYVLDRLLKDSDNIAQNMLMRYVSESDLNAEFANLNPGSSFLSQNTTSSKEVSDFVNILYSEVLQKMESTSFDDRISTGLDKDIVFAHKIGSWPDSWHDCGVAKKDGKEVLVCLMSGNASFESFQTVAKKVGEFVSLILE